MKKIYFLVASTILLSVAGAQPFILSDNTNVKRCATVEVLAEARRNNPGAETDAQFESWINNKIQQRRNAMSNPVARLNVIPYNLPVIFHIISNGEALGTTYNVAASNITQQMLQINKDYANKSNSPYSVSSTTGLQFSLCQKDPSGNVLAEPGIERLNRNNYGWTDPTTAGWTTTYITNTIKPGSIWDPSRYLNVWLVPYMPGTVAGTEILGFATFPSSSGLAGLNEAETANTAGVVIKYSTVGSIFQPVSCASTYGKGKTLSHELGHFFGLRHIWGDANCATDYVDDTPVHFTSNSGIPTHPKPNSCGTADEMFENYMDYSDDIALNTFTINQVDRMQTVMVSSPRRNTLAASNAGFVAVTATNRISFNDCTGAMTVSEAGTLGTTSRYRDISLYLNVDDKATAAATVTLATTGTAVSGTHYQIISGNTLTFTAGDSYKPVTIRILDNAAVDGDRTIILNYSISGTGVTAGTTAQTETITITDDDNIVVGQNTVNALSEAFENGTGTFGLPAGWGILATGAPFVDRFVTSANGDAGGLGKAAHVTNDIALRPNIYTHGIAGATILQSPVIDPSRYTSLGNVSFKYKVGGRSTDYAIFTYNYPGINTFYYFGSTTGSAGYGPYYSTSATPLSGNPTLATPAAIGNSKFAIDFYWTTGSTTGGIDPGFNVDDVFYTATPFNIETVISSSYGFNVPVATVNNFKSTNSKAVASISAAGSALSGVTAAVSEAGTDRPSFVANGTTYLRSRKSLTIAASPANTTVSTTIKLYYTTAEVADWGTALPNLKIMRVNSGVSLSSALNFSNAIIVTPTMFDDKRTTDGYVAFTATFTGFGQFVLVETNAVLPLRWLSFAGTLEKDVVKLTWKTAEEINNSGFEVQRSTDATTFTKIGWVAASTTNRYELPDANLVKGTKYYYRLKQIDKDGNFTYSPVVSIVYTGSNSITVFPNPVKNSLLVQQTGASRTSVVVTDLTGKTVYSNTFAAGTLQINAQPWSSGIYMVRVINNDETSSFKIIKE